MRRVVKDEDFEVDRLVEDEEFAYEGEFVFVFERKMFDRRDAEELFLVP